MNDLDVQFIAVEGVIGVGKTSLAKRLAAMLGGYALLEEVEENPFLPDFYKDSRGYAFQTQIFFLLSRYRQQQRILQSDLFRRPIVSDYMFQKDSIFANITLDDCELDMYNQIFSLMERGLPQPDRVIYLQASIEVLMARIEKRGRPYEADIDPGYLETLAEAYTYFFSHYEGAPVLVVNTNDLDLEKNEKMGRDMYERRVGRRGGKAVCRARGESR